MRSHSRADFYAKALALVFLSGLAAIGVAIDHWPTPQRLPEIGFAKPERRTPVVQTVEEIAGLGDVLLPLTPAERPRRLVASRPLPRPRWSASFRPEALSVDPAAPEIAPLPLPADVARLTLPLPTLQLAAAPELVETWQPMSAPAMTLVVEEEGFFAGALKKTSASLDKARTSLVDAVRVVGGAFPRILKR